MIKDEVFRLIKVSHRGCESAFLFRCFSSSDWTFAFLLCRIIIHRVSEGDRVENTEKTPD